MRRDILGWFDALAPEDGDYDHDDEGPDDMPAHLKALLTGVSLSLPVARRQAGARHLAGHFPRRASPLAAPPRDRAAFVSANEGSFSAAERLGRAMTIDITARFGFSLAEPTDFLLQFEAASLPEQAILRSRHAAFEQRAFRPRARAGRDRRAHLGARAQAPFEVDYSARVEIRRDLPDPCLARAARSAYAAGRDGAIHCCLRPIARSTGSIRSPRPNSAGLPAAQRIAGDPRLDRDAISPTSPAPRSRGPPRSTASSSGAASAATTRMC